jgi:hypothetical protein
MSKERLALPSDVYWAKEPGDKIIQYARQMRHKFFEFFSATTLWTRIQRSYLYFHGLYNEREWYGRNAIKRTGPEGANRAVVDNEYRSVISLLKTYVTQAKTEWDSIAKNSDTDALNSVKLANNILDGYTLDAFKTPETALSQAVEDALVMTTGYVWALWNEMGGKETDVQHPLAPEPEGEEAPAEGQTLPEEPQNLRIVHEGEFDFLNPSILDVVYDFTPRDRKKSAWVLVRRIENRWDLMAEFPELAEKIKGLPALSDDRTDAGEAFLDLEVPELESPDHTWVYYFYHKQTPALPNGRVVRFAGEVVLKDRALHEGCIPVLGLIPSQYMLTAFGYSHALDLQGPQEALNGVASTILTNQNSLGLNKIWFKAGEPINQADLEPGVTAIQTITPPQNLNFLSPSPELFQAVEMYVGMVQRLSGVAGASRGENPPNVRAASALALLDSRTVQSASDLIANYRQLQAEVGTAIIYSLRAHASDERLVSTVGQNGKRFLVSFTGEDLAPIDKVAIVTGNPLMGTLSGRLTIAESLIQTGLIKTPEEYLTVLQSGNLDRLTETNEMQLRSAQAENDAILRGEEPGTALVVDDHVLHIKKMISILDTPQSRQDPNIAPKALAHIATHVQMLQDPMVQQMMIMLGYQLPPVPGAPPGAPPPAGPGGPGGPGAPPQQAAPPVSEAIEGPTDAVESRVAAAEQAYEA